MREELAEVVRDRLRKARQAANLTINDVADAINAAGFDGQKRYGPVDVFRYEGGESNRKPPRPPVEYVEAAALVFKLPTDWLLATDLEEWASSTRNGGPTTKRNAATSGSMPLKELEQIRLVLAEASGLPYDPAKVGANDSLYEAHQELERIFWRAFGDCGLSHSELIASAKELGQRLVTPDRLPIDGFKAFNELTPVQYRQFWRLQFLALEVLVRDQSTRSRLAKRSAADHAEAPHGKVRQTKNSGENSGGQNSSAALGRKNT